MNQCIKKWAELTRTATVKKGVTILLMKLGQTILGFVTALLLARILGPDKFGLYSYVFVIVITCSIPVQFGICQVVIRETAQYKERNDHRTIFGVWLWATASLGLICLLGILIVFSSITLLDWSGGETYRNLIVPASALFAFMLVSQLLGAQLAGMGSVLLGQLPDKLMRPAILVLIIVIIFLVRPKSSPSAQSALMWHAAAAFFAVLVAIYYLQRDASRFLSGPAKPLFRLKDWSLSVVPISFASGMQIVMQNTDILMLGVLTENNKVGFYRVATQLSVFVIFGQQALNKILPTYFAYLLSNGEYGNLERMVKISSLAMFGMAFCVFGFYILFGREIISVGFGKDYGSAVVPLIVLAGGYLLSSAMGNVGTLLNMAGYENEVFKVAGVSAILNLLANLTLVPVYGIVGAAIATACTTIFWNFWLRNVAIRVLGIDCLRVWDVRPSRNAWSSNLRDHG